MLFRIPPAWGSSISSGGCFPRPSRPEPRAPRAAERRRKPWLVPLRRQVGSTTWGLNTHPRTPDAALCLARLGSALIVTSTYRKTAATSGWHARVPRLPHAPSSWPRGSAADGPPRLARASLCGRLPPAERLATRTTTIAGSASGRGGRRLMNRPSSRSRRHAKERSPRDSRQGAPARHGPRIRRRPLDPSPTGAPRETGRAR